MRVFSKEGAVYHCANFPLVSNVQQESLEDFNWRRLRGVRYIDEGTALFDEYRACALRDTERYLFLSASHYRRALGLMIPSSSHWAHVTLYYGTWFAAHALLGLFGCYVLHKAIIEVDQSSPGSQKLERKRIGNRLNEFYLNERGSHRQFWEAFYTTAPRISPSVDPQHSHHLLPLLNDQMWLINQRNKINYRVIDSMDFSRDFERGFSTRHFPIGLPGDLYMQYTVCEGLMMIGFSIASEFQLETDALAVNGRNGSLIDSVRRSVFWPKVPRLVNKTQGQQAFGT